MFSSRDSLKSVITNRYGPEVFTKVRDLGEFRKKRVRLESSLAFLMKCRDTDIIPTCARIKPRNDIPFSDDILRSASVRLLKRMIRNSYCDLDKVNRALYGVHCECSAVLSIDDFNMCDRVTYLQADRVYELCSVKHDRKYKKFYDRQKRNTIHQEEVSSVINISSTTLNSATESVLAKGLNFATTPQQIPYENIISSVEEVIIRNKLPSIDSESLRQDVSVILRRANLPKCNISSEERVALKNLRENKDLCVLRADKGNATVVLDSIDYDQKIRDLLSDTSVYKPVSYDPTARVTRRIRAVIRDNQEIMEEDDFCRLYKPKIVQPPKLYGLPKVHKSSVPLRPIVSQINSPTYSLAGYVAKMLQPLVGKTSSFVKDSRHFISIIRDMKMEPDDIMVSFDVESLFTNVPLKECVDLIRHKLSEHTMPEGYITLLRNCLDGSYFLYRGQHYLQIDGVAMGSPVAPVMANIWMEYFESLIQFPSSLKLWKRYVDDVFCIMKGNQPEVEQFLQHLNSIHHKIRFTYELQSDRTLPFLDVKVMVRSDGSLTHTVYRKPTHTDKYLNAMSHHHPTHIASVVNSLVDRAYALCDPEFLQGELSHVQGVLEKNGYRVRNVCARRPNRVRKVDVPRNRAYLPYIRGVTDKVGSLLKKYAIRTVFTPLRKIAAQVGTVKDTIPYQTPGVYKVDCSCGSSYIGQTKRTIAERVKEHIAAVKNRQVEKSAIAEHLLESGSNHWIELHKPVILSNDRHYYSRIVREAVEIKKHKNFNRDCGYKLSSTWDPVIKKCSRRVKSHSIASDVVSVVCRDPNTSL